MTTEAKGVDVRVKPWDALRKALSIIDPMIHLDHAPTRDQLVEARGMIESAMLGIDESRQRRSSAALARLQGGKGGVS